MVASELMRLPPLYEVDATGIDTPAGDQGCLWTVTFFSAVGNPELMTGEYCNSVCLSLYWHWSITHDTSTCFFPVTAFNGDESTDTGYSVTLGDDYSIIRDTISITTRRFQGRCRLDSIRTVKIQLYRSCDSLTSKSSPR